MCKLYIQVRGSCFLPGSSTKSNCFVAGGLARLSVCVWRQSRLTAEVTDCMEPIQAGPVWLQQPLE